VDKAIKQANRALVLTPGAYVAKVVSENLKAAGLTVFDASDVEESIDRFTTANKAALVLTNRYDGIDLLGDSCRMLVMEGLPAGVNLQESFLLTRLRDAAGRILQSLND
jgi:Rad3-related DNA helicase